MRPSAKILCFYLVNSRIQVTLSKLIKTKCVSNFEVALLKDDAICRTLSALIHLKPGKAQNEALKRARKLILYDNPQLDTQDTHSQAQILTVVRKTISNIKRVSSLHNYHRIRRS